MTTLGKASESVQFRRITLLPPPIKTSLQMRRVTMTPRCEAGKGGWGGGGAGGNSAMNMPSAGSSRCVNGMSVEGAGGSDGGGGGVPTSAGAQYHRVPGRCTPLLPPPGPPPAAVGAPSGPRPGACQPPCCATRSPSSPRARPGTTQRPTRAPCLPTPASAARQ